nr:immunoglobulin heavy chain junction region [Mus musculus]MBK4198310.1 immunoglobulin heavy chain junction region [Mus musculus]
CARIYFGSYFDYW